MKNSKGKPLFWSSAIVLATLLLHGLIVTRFPPGANFLKYQLAARQYNERTLDRERLADFSPLYFHLHAIAQRWLPHPDQAILWLQVLLTAMAAGLLFLLLRLFFPPLVAGAGTAILVLDRSIMVYEHIFEPEMLLLFFLLGFLLSCCSGSRARHFLAGLFLALALLCRLNFLPLAVLAPWYFWLQQRQFRVWLKASSRFLLPVLLALGFLSLRNHAIRGNFSPLVMNPGTVFFEGNNPNSLGQSSIYPPLVYNLVDEFPGQPDYQHVLYRLVARKDTGKELGIGAVNRYWSGKALNFIRDHPIHFLGLLGAKTTFFFHDFRRHDLANAFWDDRELSEKRFPAVPLALVSALAIAGLLLASGDWRRFLLFYGLIFSQMAVLLLTYVSARQRIAAYPAFIFFACWTMRKLWAWGKWLPRILATAAIICLSLLLSVENDAMKEETHQWKNFSMAQGSYRQALKQRESGRWRAAGISSWKALAAAPWLEDSLRPADLTFTPWGYSKGALVLHETLANPDFSSLFDRGLLSLAAGELDLGEAIFKRLMEEGHRFKRDYDGSSQPSYYLARIALKKKENAQALAWLDDARRKAPGDPEVLACSYVLTGQEKYRDLIARYFSGLDADFFIGKAFLENGQAAQAVPFFSRLSQRLPFYRRGRIYLAASLIDSGSFERGAETFFTAVSRRQDPIFLEKEMLEGSKKWLAALANDARNHFFFGFVLRLFGHYDQALSEQERALALAPNHALIKKEIDYLGKITAEFLH